MLFYGSLDKVMQPIQGDQVHHRLICGYGEPQDMVDSLIFLANNFKKSPVLLDKVHPSFIVRFLKPQRVLDMLDNKLGDTRAR